MGTIDEARLATKLRRNKVVFKREVELSHPIGDTGVKIEGRLDFWISSDPPKIIEKKSVISPTRTKSIVTEGKIDPSHLAQVLVYMAVSKISTGSVHVTSWSWDTEIDGLVVTGDREFQIILSPSGEITIDGQPYPAHIRQLQQWFRAAANAMNQADVELPPRPMFKASWQNPCTKCPLAGACDQYDLNRNVQLFWQETQNLEPSPGPIANIPEPKLKKGKKNEQNQLSDSVNTNTDTGRISDKKDLFGRQIHSRAGDLFSDSDGD
jgi:hypothetical protein